MHLWVIPVVAAVVTSVVGPLLVVWRQGKQNVLLQSVRDENEQQHDVALRVLHEIHGDMGDVKVGQSELRHEIEGLVSWVEEHEIYHAAHRLRDEHPPERDS